MITHIRIHREGTSDRFYIVGGRGPLSPANAGCRSDGLEYMDLSGATTP